MYIYTWKFLHSPERVNALMVILATSRDKEKEQSTFLIEDEKRPRRASDNRSSFVHNDTSRVGQMRALAQVIEVRFLSNSPRELL